MSLCWMTQSLDICVVNWFLGGWDERFVGNSDYGFGKQDYLKLMTYYTILLSQEEAEEVQVETEVEEDYYSQPDENTQTNNT